MEKYNDAEIEAALKTIVILVDTREKQWEHIKTALEELRCPIVMKKLDFGDYSYQYTDPNGNVVTCENEIVVERKANLDEICGNFTKNRDRFKREFAKGKEAGAIQHFCIENANWGMIAAHRYRSRFAPASLEASIWSFVAEFDLKGPHFWSREAAGREMYLIFRYHLRNKLKKWRDDGAAERLCEDT